eukprot:TRINITY_DN22958_c0_g1_i1.p1 TRINITY_DN22958_c0_g1~~TRINITY_DN22958_c0_g1_i1.p1  ORF type:complete len:1076 (-),score=330.44 TRINITY_DN22958_c0_g1_i1:87-3287(-)
MAANVLKRLAALNRSGRLAKPLQYSQVKFLTSQVGEEPVLEILQRLDDRADEVEDPAEFVKDAAAAVIGEGEPPAAAASRPAQQAARGGMLSRRIAALNSSQRLHKQIDLVKVEVPLSSLGMAKAMTILQGLEDTAEDIRDPTAYIRTAVLSAGGSFPPEDEDEAEVEVEVDGEDDGEEMNWYYQAEPGEEGPEDQPEEELAAPRTPPRTAVKREHPQAASRPWQRVKAESAWATKTEELTEAERIERRVHWLNKNAGLASPISIDSVLPALDSIGFRQSMRVLRRLEESAATIAEPDEFIRDLVGRSGWVWAKAEVIDEDTKVAKRVAWLNQFGCLSKPIEWEEVADVLDGLKVAHAMVLLRELEMQGKKVSDPTAYIKRTAELAGADDIALPSIDGADSAVGRKIEELNGGGTLASPINAAAINDGLSRLGEEEALQLLEEVAAKGLSVKDPTGYLRFKLKARLASTGQSLEAPSDDGTKILKRIEWLNDYGGLLQDIDYHKVASMLEKAGLDHAMTLLKELEDQRQGVENPTSFILESLRSSRKRVAPAPAAASKVPRSSAVSAAVGNAGPATALQALNDFMAFLNKRPGKRGQVKLSEIAGALDALGTQRAMRVLREMKERGLGLDDPVSYIKAAAQRHGLGPVKTEDGSHEPPPEEGDDVAKLMSRMTWLNQFAGLAKPISKDEVVGALYCLGVPQSMSILRGLQERGDSVADPTRYIKQAVQHANRAAVAGNVKTEEQDEYEDELEEEEQDEDLADIQEAEEEEEGGGEENWAQQEEEHEEAQEEEWPEVEEEGDWEGYDGGEEEVHDWNENADEEAEEPVAAPPQKRARTGPSADAKAAATAAARAAAAKRAEQKRNAPKRVVGGVTGYDKLLPSRATPKQAYRGDVKTEPKDDDQKEEKASLPAGSKSSSTVHITPQEKMVQVRNYALKHKLHLDDQCLKAMSRLPFYRAKDLIEEVLLGGRQRRGVSNPSRYLMAAVQKQSVGLGVEQGIAMELAVSLGVVLNNDALDELASIPRKESHAIIRELSRNAGVRGDPLAYIREEVLKCRANLDARPFPG